MKTTIEDQIQQIEFRHHPFDVIDDRIHDYDRHPNLFLIDFNREHGQFIFNEEESKPREEEQQQHQEEMDDPIILSQHLSQLSTEEIDDGKRQHSPTTHPFEPVTKKTRSEPESLAKFNNESFPSYLQKNQDVLQELLTLSVNHDLSFDDLQSLAFFRHQMGIYQQHERLWLKFIRFGTGQLSDEDRQSIEQRPIIQPTTMTRMMYGPFWMATVKRWLLLRPNVQPLLDRGETDEQNLCELAAIERLQQARERFEYYHLQYEEKKTQCLRHGYESIELGLIQYVEQCGIEPFRLKTDFKSNQLNVEFREHLLQLRLKQEHPTEYQMQMIQRLFTLHTSLEEVKQQQIEYHERLRYHQLPSSYDTLQVAYPSILKSIDDLILRQQYQYEYDTSFDALKINLMAIDLAVIEAKIDQYQQQIEEETKQMWKYHHEQPMTYEMNTTLMHLLDQRILNIQEKLRYQYDYHLTCHIRISSHGTGLSSLIIDPSVKHLLNQFTTQQLQLLRRGPTYILPYQLHLPSMKTSDEERLKKQYGPLHQRLVILFSKYHIPLTQQENLKFELKKEFHHLFSTTNTHLPNTKQLQGALYEDRMVRSIRSTLKQHHLFLRRTANHQNTFYLGQQIDFDQAIYQFMSTQTDYTLVYTIDQDNYQEINRKIQSQYRQMNLTFEIMMKEKHLTQEIYDRLRTNLDRIHLSYLYFLPELSEETKTMVVKPMFASYHSPTARLAYVLQQLLRPIIQQSLRRTSFINETNFIDRLYQYTQGEYRLQSTTLFATVTSTHFPTMTIKHSTLIEHIRVFLQFHLVNNRLEYTSMLTGRPQSMTINTCIRLIELFLEHNLFYYEKKIYKFTKGAPNGFILTELLSIMYLSIWQRNLFEDPRMTNEFIGSFKNQTILTWNGSMEEFHQWMRSISERCPQVPLESFIGRSIDFLNVHLENRHGQLYTTYRSPISLPYVIDHPQADHRHWFYSTLIHAVRCCSQLNDFILVRIHLEMAYLSHGYSKESLARLFHDFYQYFNWNPSHFRLQTSTYERYRQQMFQYCEKQQMERIKIDRYQMTNRTIDLYYLFDQGPLRSFHERFFQIWSKYLQYDVHLSLEKTNIILKGKQLYSLHTLLTDYKPLKDAHVFIH